MGEKFEIIGSESNIICYNLNRQFSNVKKVIITPDIILHSFETSNIKELFSKLKQTNKHTYKQTFNEDKHTISNEIIKNELYKEIQERLKKNSDGFADIELQNYNFMSSVSNTKYTVTLRCESFSLSMYYEEKGQIISSIRNLLKKYLEFEGNISRINLLENFQIEIYETEETFKHIYLKKERDSLILSSTFGTQFCNPIDIDLGSEFYFSIGENFKYYKNKQTHAMLKEHSKLEEKEINPQEKILNNEELIKINENTKNINDALIEIQITPKEKIRIINVSLLENSITTGSEEGFLIHKSSKNYNAVSVITLRENFSEDMTNPKYLLIRNQEEVKELLENTSNILYLDGIIFTFNFYNPILDKIGNEFDIDILFYNKPLQKSLEVKIDFHNFSIETQSENYSSGNPFSNIIEDTKKENDTFLEKLKNMNLDTVEPQRPKNNFNYNETSRNPQEEDYTQISDITKSIISSPDSSSKKKGIDWGSSPSEFNNKSQNSSNSSKNAIGMLADTVLNPSQEEPKQENPQNESEHQLNLNQFQNSDLVMNDVKSNQINSIENEEQTMKSFDDMFANTQENSQNNFNQNTNEYQSNQNQFNNQFENNNFSNQNNFNQNQNQPQNNQFHQTNQQNYNQQSQIKLLTTPNINSGHYFVDINSITQVTSGEIYFMTTNPNEITNSNLKYVFPISTVENPQPGSYLIVNSPQDFFLISKFPNNKFFFSLSNIEQNIKETFIENAISKLGKISLIISKNDINIIQKFKQNVEEIFIKDLSSQEEFLNIKNSL